MDGASTCRLHHFPSSCSQLSITYLCRVIFYFISCIRSKLVIYFCLWQLQQIALLPFTVPKFAISQSEAKSNVLISYVIIKITISLIVIGLKNFYFATNSLAKLLSDSLLLDTLLLDSLLSDSSISQSHSKL